MSADEAIKPGRGRQTTFRPEFVEEVRCLCEAGVRDSEIAAHLGVHRSTLARWQQSHPELFAARKLKHETARLPPGKGRPRLYRPEFAERAKRLYALGYSNPDVARLMGLSQGTIWRWQREYAAFGEAVMVGRAAARRA